jgi:oligo-1,6-glucosidase
MNQTWWKEAVVYQIYPRSFKDSDGDGVGDLPGIIQKLDYLQALGVSVVWLCPVYRSPNDDNGYDISDYHRVADEFGTFADWEALRDGLHARGIKLIMDLVVNHTSDEHPWFQEARTAKDNPYRGLYIWRPGKDGGPPNNWESLFGGSAWEYDGATGEYYLHLFSKKQPDLNWENPALREKIYEMMTWWLDRGIDGFRLDAINLISKVPGLPDAPVTPTSRYGFVGDRAFNGPRLLEFLGEMKARVLANYDVVTVGETSLVTTEHGIDLTHEETGSLSMLFQFEHMDLDKDSESSFPRWSVKPWSLVELKQVMTRWQRELGGKGWNSQYLSNHDLPRAVSRFGDDGRYRVASAKLLAIFVHLLHGTPYIYQGEEIGMTNVRFASIDDYRDIETLNMYREFVEERGVDEDRVMAMIHAKGRDNARTPMQWDAGPNAGFTAGTPWIGVNPNYTQINVEAALADPGSVFYTYRRLTELRKAHPVIVYGAYDLLLAEHEEIYAFTRTLESERLLVLLNFSANTPSLELPAEVVAGRQELLISNYEVDAAESPQGVCLRPYEARVYRLS